MPFPGNGQRTLDVWCKHRLCTRRRKETWAALFMAYERYIYIGSITSFTSVAIVNDDDNNNNNNNNYNNNYNNNKNNDNNNTTTSIVLKSSENQDQGRIKTKMLSNLEIDIQR